MKKSHFILSIAAALLLSACQSSEQIKPIREETIAFDIDAATEMIEKKESMILEFALREKVSQLEYEEAERALTEEFGNHARDILTMVLINNMDAEPGADRVVQQNMLYPTVFHEGITITDAVIYKSYYENEFFNQTRLSIKEEYIGEDEKLKDWSREYFFTPSNSGEWELSGFGGVMNFLGEEFSANYLQLNFQG